MPKKSSWKKKAGKLGAVIVGVPLAFIYRGRRIRGRENPHPDPKTLIIIPEREQDGLIPLTGGVNFRDIGGYKTADGRQVKYGIVYRSGTLDALTGDDLQTLSDLTITRVFDLRLEEEAEKQPDRLPPNAVYEHTPIQAGSNPITRVVSLMRNIDRLNEFVVNSYTKHLIDAEAKTYAGIFKKIAAEDGASVIHCTAGKDRTGVGVALLLSALGVPDETIVADYSLSNRSYDMYYKDAVDQLAPLKKLGILPEDISGLLVSDPEFMRQSLRYLHECYGSAEAYLQKAGVDAATLNKLQSRLLA